MDYPPQPKVIHRRRTTIEEWSETPGPIPALDGVDEQLDDEQLVDEVDQDFDE